MPDINGTEERDLISGTADADNINALGGDDDVRAGGGDDVIDGGTGDDFLDGEGGNDTIDGGDGNDIISGGSGTNTLRGGNGDDRLLVYGEADFADGGAGNDEFIVQLSNFNPDPFAPDPVNSTIIGGAGNDLVSYRSEGAGGSIDLGADNDTLNLQLVGTGLTITLGTGSDSIALSNLSDIDPGSATITDFVAGDAGEVIDFSGLRTSLFNYNGFDNPFGTGHFILEASGSGSVIRFAPFADGNVTFSLFFPNIAPSQFTAHNFGGLAPDGTTTNGPPINGTPEADNITGTNLGETIDGRASDDIINALGGDDTIIGGSGSDTLNGGDGDDLFIFDFTGEPGFNPSQNPANDAAINGGNGTDTIRIIGSNQGNDIIEYDLGAGDLPITSIEGLELSGNTALLGTIAQFSAFTRIIAPNLRITDNGSFDPAGYFEVIQLSLPDGGVSIDLSGNNVHVLNIVSGNGNDTIIGPDSGVSDAEPWEVIQVGIDVRGGNDTVTAGNISTRILSSGGNNNFTGSGFDDFILLSGDGNNTVNGGGGNDEIIIGGQGVLSIDGGAGNDTISVTFLDNGDSVVGGDGYDRLIIDTGNDFDDYDITGVTFSSDIEVLESQGQGNVIATIAQLTSFDELLLRYVTIADGGSVAFSTAPVRVNLSQQGNVADFSAITSQSVTVFGGAGNDTIIGGQDFNSLLGGGGNDWLRGGNVEDNLFGDGGFDVLEGFGGADTLRGGNEDDRLIGGADNDWLEGGEHIDTAVFSGNRADYTITQIQLGVFEVVGPDGTDRLETIEFAEFADQTVRLYRGEGVSVNFNPADPFAYQVAMTNIRDFSGNDLGGYSSWLWIGAVDINGDGDVDQLLVNAEIGRFATVGTAPDGLVYFDDHGWAGETRVAGIYIDPLVLSGNVQAGGPFDSQRRFQNDLLIQNINRVLGADDYDNDGIQEVYFALTDGTAYLRAFMHADGNIRYANYQSQQQMIDYLTANGFGEETWGSWLYGGSSQELPASDKPGELNNPVADPENGEKADGGADSSSGSSSGSGSGGGADWMMPGEAFAGDLILARQSFLEQHLQAEFFG